MKLRVTWKNRPAVWITAAGILILGILLALWGRSHPGTGWPEWLAALASAALFAWAWGVFADRWMGDWSARRVGRGEDGPAERPARGILWRVFFACLGAELLAMGLFWLLRVLQSGWMGPAEALRLWNRLDARHYQDIARDWYLSQGDMGRVVQLVFLPGYPLAVRLVGLLTGDLFLAGFVVSLLSIAGAGVVLYCLVRLDREHAAALRTVKYALLLPGAVFFSGPMSESLFFLLSLCSVYLARRKRWLPACLLGGLAAFTRSLGLLLLVPVGYELLADTLTRRPGGWDQRAVERRAWSFGALLLIPAGFGVYCLICWTVAGDPFRFLEYQRDHWDQSLSFFFNTAAYQTEYVLKRIAEGSRESLLGLWLPNLLTVFLAPALMIAGGKRIRPSYLAYFLAYYVVAAGATWLLSAPRYVAAAFPLAVALGALTEDRRADSALTILCTAAYVIYDFMLVARWQVW